MKCYKLFRIKNGVLFPLYVLAQKPVPVGVWLKAEVGTIANDGKHVKSRLGNLALRPGFHASTVPVATHIGKKKNKTDKLPAYRNKEHVWAECEVNTNIHYEDYKSRKTIPNNGYYRFKTNPNMYGDWIITSDIKVNKVLSDEEVFAINSITGIHDLPRED